MQMEAVEASPASLVSLSPSVEGDVRALEVAAVAFEALCRAAAAAGVELLAVSGFRSIERQTNIWNRKISEARDDGLDPVESLDRVLEYSAPPGWSRHHWGTDIDVVTAALEEVPRLEPQDWVAGGVCHDGGQWLEENANQFGFARPYEEDRGGFRPEPWHWSFVTTSRALLHRLDDLPWQKWLEAEPFLGAGLLAGRFDQDFPRFVRGIAPALLPGSDQGSL